MKYAYSDPFHRLAITTSKHARALQRARKILALPRIMKNKTNQTIVLYLKMSTMTTCNFYSYHIAKVINYLPNLFSIGTFLTFRKPIKTFLTYRESWWPIVFLIYRWNGSQRPQELTMNFIFVLQMKYAHRSAGDDGILIKINTKSTLLHIKIKIKIKIILSRKRKKLNQHYYMNSIHASYSY